MTQKCTGSDTVEVYFSFIHSPGGCPWLVDNCPPCSGSGTQAPPCWASTSLWSVAGWGEGTESRLAARPPEALARITLLTSFGKTSVAWPH